MLIAHHHALQLQHERLRFHSHHGVAAVQHYRQAKPIHRPVAAVAAAALALISTSARAQSRQCHRRQFRLLHQFIHPPVPHHRHHHRIHYPHLILASFLTREFRRYLLLSPLHTVRHHLQVPRSSRYEPRQRMICTALMRLVERARRSMGRSRNRRRDIVVP